MAVKCINCGELAEARWCYDCLRASLDEAPGGYTFHKALGDDRFRVMCWGEWMLDARGYPISYERMEDAVRLARRDHATRIGQPGSPAW